MKKYLIICLFFILPFGITAIAGEADVVHVTVKMNSKNSYDFSATVHHKDTGWDHYANKWEIIDEKGTILGTRILHHPHVNEQPFTRSLSDVRIPASISKVTIRGHDSIHEYGGKVINVELPH
jgi:hypothetical protein